MPRLLTMPGWKKWQSFNELITTVKTSSRYSHLMHLLENDFAHQLSNYKAPVASVTACAEWLDRTTEGATWHNFKAVDRDHDGNIDFNEFAVAVLAGLPVGEGSMGDSASRCLRLIRRQVLFLTLDRPVTGYLNDEKWNRAISMGASGLSASEEWSRRRECQNILVHCEGQITYDDFYQVCEQGLISDATMTSSRRPQTCPNQRGPTSAFASIVGQGLQGGFELGKKLLSDFKVHRSRPNSAAAAAVQPLPDMTCCEMPVHEALQDQTKDKPCDSKIDAPCIVTTTSGPEDESGEQSGGQENQIESNVVADSEEGETLEALARAPSDEFEGMDEIPEEPAAGQVVDYPKPSGQNQQVNSELDSTRRFSTCSTIMNMNREQIQAIIVEHYERYVIGLLQGAPFPIPVAGEDLSSMSAISALSLMTLRTIHQLPADMERLYLIGSLGGDAAKLARMLRKILDGDYRLAPKTAVVFCGNWLPEGSTQPTKLLPADHESVLRTWMAVSALANSCPGAVFLVRGRLESEYCNDLQWAVRHLFGFDEAQKLWNPIIDVCELMPLGALDSKWGILIFGGCLAEAIQVHFDLLFDMPRPIRLHGVDNEVEGPYHDMIRDAYLSTRPLAGGESKGALATACGDHSLLVQNQYWQYWANSPEWQELGLLLVAEGEHCRDALETVVIEY